MNGLKHDENRGIRTKGAPEMQLPYDVVLFDLDGTLTRSHPGIVASARHSLVAMGVDCAGRDLTLFVGPPLYESYRFLGLDDGGAREAIRIFRAKYETEGWKDAAVFPGVPSMLRSLKARGAFLGVVTAKPTVQAERVLKGFDLWKYFDCVTSTHEKDDHCDKAELIRRALPEKYRQACMVGDRMFDMAGAVGAGVDGIGALYGYGTREELLSSGAAAVADSIEALTGLLLGGLKPERGLFLTLEGPDGCGKSTQARLLGEWLRRLGHRVVETREPGGCPISERIRSLVLDAKEKGMSDVTEALLFAASRAQHVRDVIRPALERGDTVLCDRFVDSSIVYQGEARGLGRALVASLNAPAVDGVMPDATLLLMMDPIEAICRRRKENAPDRMEGDDALARRVHEAYRALAQREPERVRAVDASGSVEQISAQIRQIVAEI
jgi:dTMP kinase